MPIFNLDKKGFSLVELMVVIAIISILSTIGIVVYTGTQRTGRDVKRGADLSLIKSALEQYHADQNYYPASGAWFAAGSPIKDVSGTRTYLDKIPADPRNTSTPYVYLATPSGCSNNCTGYNLCASIETTLATDSCPGHAYNFGVTPNSSPNLFE